MRNSKLDQLAATLKTAGLCASVYDAKNMAESIFTGVKKMNKENEEKIVRTMGTGKRDEQAHPLLKNKPEPKPVDRAFESVCKVMEPAKEVFVNKCPFIGAS